MKKSILTIVFTILLMCLNAYYYIPYNILTQGYEKGLGNISNPSLIWNNNPHSMVNSPGLLGFAKEGITLNFLNDNYLSLIAPGYDEWISVNSYKYDANIAYYNNGIGILFPMINPDGEFGFGFKTETMEHTVFSYDKYYSFGLAFNPMDFYNIEHSRWQVAMGMTFNIEDIENQVGDFSGNFWNMGFTGLYKPVAFEDGSLYDVEITQGLNFSNVFGNSVEFENLRGAFKSRYCRSLTFAVAGKVSMYSTKGTFIEPVSDNFFSFMYTFLKDNLFEFEDYDEDTQNGIEFGFLDIFFLRYGFSKEGVFRELDNMFDSDTFGFGIKLAANDYFEFCYDESTFGDPENETALTLNLNLKKIWSKLKTQNQM